MVVKKNQPTLHGQLKDLPWRRTPVGARQHDHGHGREEHRTLTGMPWVSLAWSGVMTEDDEPCRDMAALAAPQDGRIILAGARDKLAQIDRRSAPAGSVTIGLPAFASAAPPGPWTPSASGRHNQNGHYATVPDPAGYPYRLQPDIPS
jgi:hypothetical protein